MTPTKIAPAIGFTLTCTFAVTPQYVYAGHADEQAFFSAPAEIQNASDSLLKLTDAEDVSRYEGAKSLYGEALKAEGLDQPYE